MPPASSWKQTRSSSSSPAVPHVEQNKEMRSRRRAVRVVQATAPLLQTQNPEVMNYFRVKTRQNGFKLLCLFSLLHTNEPNLKNSQQCTTTQTPAFSCWQCCQYLLGMMLLAPLCCSLVTAHLEDEPDSNPKGSTTEHHRSPRCVGHQQGSAR